MADPSSAWVPDIRHSTGLMAGERSPYRVEIPIGIFALAGRKVRAQESPRPIWKGALKMERAKSLPVAKPQRCAAPSRAGHLQSLRSFRQTLDIHLGKVTSCQCSCGLRADRALHEH